MNVFSPISSPVTSTFIQMLMCFLIDYCIIDHLFTSVSNHSLLQLFPWLVLSFICLKLLICMPLIMITFYTTQPDKQDTSSSGHLPLCHMFHYSCFWHSETSLMFPVLLFPHVFVLLCFVCRITPLNALQDWKQVLSFWYLPWIFWFLFFFNFFLIFWFLKNFHRIALYLY